MSGEVDNDYIPLDKLAPEENAAISAMIAKFYWSGTLEDISDARSHRAKMIAMEKGFDSGAAQRLADHFDAATRRLIAMDAKVKSVFYKNLQTKLAAHLG